MVIVVNHIRTLLLNRRTTSSPLIGDEYIPSTYKPKQLNENLKKVRLGLFGGSDLISMNIIIAKLLTYLHGSELSDDVISSDTRISYDVNNICDIKDRIGASSTKINISSPDALGWIGSESFYNSTRSYGKWVVDYNGTTGSVTPYSFEDALWSGSPNVVSLGVSFPLPGSNLSIIVPSGQAGKWDVSLLSPTTYDWVNGIISAAELVPDLFMPINSNREDYWYNLFIYSKINMLRASAAALALASRIDE